MSYIQVETQGGYITRSLQLFAIARSDGYPGYLANITNQRKSVRTILYLEEDILYLTEDKTFFLSQLADPNDTISFGRWIFTSNPDAEPLSLSDISSTWGTIVYEWSDRWANMKTDDPTRNDLLWPVRTWEEAWNYILEREYTIMYQRIDSDIWISPVSSFGGTAMVTGAFAWRGRGAPFKLQKRGNTWGLQYLEMGTIDAEQVVNFKGNREGAYIKSWNEGESHRWVLTDTIGEALFFNITSSQEGVYQFWYQGIRLNEGGCWRVRPFTICGVNSVDGGVEFYNGNNNPEIFLQANVINPGLTDTERYFLGQNRFLLLKRDQNNLLPDFNPEGVTLNLPRGSPICNENEWEGTNINCYSRANTPYVQARGQEQCTTLDDFSHDIHCQQWAITNRGPQIDQRLFNLCRDVSSDTYNDVCSCFRPDNVYYNALLAQRRDDPELARQVANDVRATNLLQCVSGLCVPGTFSANIFYSGSRRCDVCIQALRTNIQAGGNITGNINLRQICTQTDVTYTWTDLITRLQDLGAYRIINTNGTTRASGTFPHVIINQQGTSIKFITSTTGGRRTLQGLRSLSLLDERDAQGNIILTQERFRSNPASYSNDALLFFLDARED